MISHEKRALPAEGGILFYGDPHGDWDPLAEAVLAHRPAAVVLLGDMGLDKPLRDRLSAVWDLVPQGWHWIIGNHDTDTLEEYEFLIGSHPDGDIGGRVVEIGGLRVAGLGGIYAERVWRPGREPQFRTRVEMTRKTARFDRLNGGIPRSSRAVIFPEDHETLGRLQADILVCHEAPSSLDRGFPVIDDLARDMRARLIVHGHHHHAYAGRTATGIRVVGLGIADPWAFSAADFDSGGY